MENRSKKWFDAPSPFDPDAGATVIEPLGEGIGHWVGALSALYDEDSGSFYLYYRVRRPIGQGRGYQCNIARSTDGVNFSTVWTATKEQFDTESFEGGSLTKTPDGKFRLYLSYLDAADRRWKIALLETDQPESFNPADRQVVLRGEDIDSEGVKDPYIAQIGGRYYLFVNYAPRSRIRPEATEDELHGTGNVFATTAGGSGGLAVSDDGVRFEWKGDVVSPGRHWDRLLTRIDTMLYTPPYYTLLYSGRGSIEETYEDRTGLAVSLDLETFHKLTEECPWAVSPHGTGALRYADAVVVGQETFLYYECARADNSHEIRLNRLTDLF